MTKSDYEQKKLKKTNMKFRFWKINKTRFGIYRQTLNKQLRNLITKTKFENQNTRQNEIMKIRILKEQAATEEHENDIRIQTWKDKQNETRIRTRKDNKKKSVRPCIILNVYVWAFV